MLEIENSINQRELELDKEYDVYEFGEKAGVLEFGIKSEDLMPEKIVKIILTLKQKLDIKKVKFNTLKLFLRYDSVDKDGNETISIKIFEDEIDEKTILDTVKDRIKQ